MNLYRSFGNLMEAWVSEGGQCSDSEWLENNEEDSPTPTSDSGTNLRSESVDSGVETASSDVSFLATSCFVSADVDAFAPERGGLTLASASQSPVLPSPAPFSSSSSSPRLRPSTAQKGPAALHQKVEQALQRTDSKKSKLELLTVDEVLRRRPRASFLPKRHTSELVRSQKSENFENFDLRRTVNLSLPVRQMHEMRRRPLSMSCVRQPVQTRSEDLGEVDGKGLSPGLSYLEQVCQMLEDIARQQMQMQNRASQMETDGPLELRDMETFDTCQSDSKPAEADLSSCQRLENTESAEQTSSEPQRSKDYTRGHFRHRSASDTTLATLHLSWGDRPPLAFPCKEMSMTNTSNQTREGE
ncbi:hypothetical protein L3Q82_002151 [Scortum barcoo]|uniref:Uncharacterized protein n=1 Tax=Scortum barcoo TaxID=214431 RepID=A0ACB8W4W0_9TELE|nr:hypothetical protein L3Q82_002151 [Scortum barcoo]